MRVDKNMVLEAEKRGIGRYALYSRLKRGISFEDALKMKNIKKRKWGLTKTQLLIANRNKLTYRTVMQRIKKGWSVEEAISIKIGNTYFMYELFEPNEVKKAFKILKQNGISLDTFKYRVLKGGWELEKALTYPVDPNKGVKAKGTRIAITEEQYKRGLENGISRHTLRERVRRGGWTIEDAVTLPLHSKRGNKN